MCEEPLSSGFLVSELLWAGTRHQVTRRGPSSGMPLLRTMTCRVRSGSRFPYHLRVRKGLHTQTEQMAGGTV